MKIIVVFDILLLPLLIQAAIRHSRMPANEFFFHPPNTFPITQTKPLYLDSILDEAVQMGKHISINTTYKFNTEIVISKCGMPVFLIFSSTKLTDVLSAQDVCTLRKAYDMTCNPGDRFKHVEITHQSDFSLNGTTLIGTIDKENGNRRLVKVHNILPPTIASVTFSLPPHHRNKYPLKIGHLLQNLENPNCQLILSVRSTAPVIFYITKCGYSMRSFPVMVYRDMIIDARRISLLRFLQAQECRKWWMKDILELELFVGRRGASGVLKFQIVDDTQDSEISIIIFILRGILAIGLILISLLIITFFYTRSSSNG